MAQDCNSFCFFTQMMEDFSGLDLPPLFGGHILEAELEPGGVELGPGEVELGPGGSELLHSAEHGSGPGHEEDEEEEEEEEEEERREREKRKYLALSKRCKEIEQVSWIKIIIKLVKIAQ